MNDTSTPARAPLPPTPWSVRAWPPLVWLADACAPAGFHHLGTCVTAGGTGARAGHTVWSGSIAGGDAGVAWEWVEIADGIVAMADPMAVTTNLQLVGRRGGVLTAAEAALVLNGIVHALPWQDEVGRALRTSALRTMH